MLNESHRNPASATQCYSRVAPSRTERRCTTEIRERGRLVGRESRVAPSRTQSHSQSHRAVAPAPPFRGAVLLENAASVPHGHESF